jgi:4-hydroxy-3-methylbut-2-enyl diphosphate reductase
MKVTLAREVGFCFGVKRAINLTRKALAENEDVFILGDLVHNRAVIAEMQSRGLRKIDKVPDREVGTLVVRAHGLPMLEIEAARAAGLRLVDATCPLVRKAQEAAVELEQRGWLVILIGDRNHPEIKGIQGQLSRPAVVVNSVEELHQANLEKRRLRKVGVIFQTTHSMERCQPIVEALARVARELHVINTRCRPATDRQLDAMELAARVDLMLVVGSRSSANTAEIARLCRSRNPRTFQIENVGDLESTDLSGVETVGITSGLSTPADLVEEVRAMLTTRERQSRVRSRPAAREFGPADHLSRGDGGARWQTEPHARRLNCN